MTIARRRTQERLATRARILDAARTLFLRDGFETVSLRKIAAAIGYTAPALYSHFPDKRALILRLCCEDFALLRRSLDTAKRVDDCVERLRAMGRAYVRFALEHPHHYRFMFMIPWAATETPENLPPEHGDPDHDAYAFLRRAVEDCIAQGRFKPEYADVEGVTQVCWGASHGVASLHIALRDDPWVRWRSPRQTAYTLVDTVIDGLCADRRSESDRAGRAIPRRTKEAP